MELEATAQTDSSLRVIITGGGTGGHIYPGIAVAKEIQRQAPTARLLFIGTPDRLEARIVPHEGFDFETVKFQGFRHKHFWKQGYTLLTLPLALWQAIRILRRFRPHVVFGTGGYVSFPVVYAAYLLHRPTIILEPNKMPGLANTLLGKSVDKVAVCFKDTAQYFPCERVHCTGTPIRKAFSVIGRTPPPDKGKKINVLVLGGSLGARSINCAMLEALEYLKPYADRLALTHQTGDTDYLYVRNGYRLKEFHAEVQRYIDDLPRMYAKSHLIICRAGAVTVAELQASRRPAILIPYPYGDRHQEDNARALQEQGLAHVILQRDVTGKVLAESIVHILDHPEDFVQVWNTLDNLAPKDAAEQLVQLCFELARNS